LQNIFEKKNLTERDICTKFITPAIVETAGWDRDTQLREELSLTKGKIIVRGKLHSRGVSKRADYVLYHKTNIPLAVVEAKDNNHTARSGIQQAIEYAELLDVPFAYSSNGDGFIEHDRSQTSGEVERELGLHEFPTPEELWRRYCHYKGIEDPEEKKIVSQDYYPSPENKSPRYYQLRAINKTIEAIAKGQNRVLLVMATGTGKTFHLIPNYLASLEIRYQEASPVSCRPQYSGGSDSHKRLQAVWFGDDKDSESKGR
jgi:type I restriction enzyme R subunit